MVERFAVTDKASYERINAALEHFGKEALDATLNTVQMSPGFAERYLYPAVIRHHRQSRWTKILWIFSPTTGPSKRYTAN